MRPAVRLPRSFGQGSARAGSPETYQSDVDQRPQNLSGMQQTSARLITRTHTETEMWWSKKANPNMWCCCTAVMEFLCSCAPPSSNRCVWRESRLQSLIFFIQPVETWFKAVLFLSEISMSTIIWRKMSGAVLRTEWGRNCQWNRLNI